MKAVSLHEPYASFVMWGWKKIETRTHIRFQGLVGKTIIIHATLNEKYIRDGAFLAKLMEFMNGEQYEKFSSAIRTNMFKGQIGKLLGTVKAVDFGILNYSHSKDAMIDCGKVERWGLTLEDPKWFKTLIPCKGHQGIFNISEDFIKQQDYK